MTNKEKYKRAFSALHASDNISLEVKNMEKKNVIKYLPRTLVAACLAIVLAVGSFSVAYAADIGGIKRSVQLWIHGDQTTAEINIDDDGSYEMTYTDADGNTQTQNGGGIAIEGNGKERPLSEEEIIEDLSEPEVEYRDDNSVWVYYKNQKIEITDKFNKDGFCFLKLTDGDETLYLTAKYQDAYAISNEKFVQPNEFD